jgi:hypothetical protein
MPSTRQISWMENACAIRDCGTDGAVRASVAGPVIVSPSISRPRRWPERL